MKASEIIRRIADVLDAQEVNQSSSTQVTNRPGQVDVDVATSTQDIERQADVNVKTMVPPLQQKLDLLKTIAGEPTEICPECGSADCSCNSGPDELDILKQNAGIKIVAASELATDTDVEN